jgi:hypothetical protein
MPANKILNEDWSEYDDRKKKHTDANFFACTEDWEVKYLIQKISKNFPQFSTDQIKKTISDCCETTKAPHPRKAFVDCVMSKLNVGAPPPNQGPGPKNPPQPPGKRPVG